jgi:hypothetical protein
MSGPSSGGENELEDWAFLPADHVAACLPNNVANEWRRPSTRASGIQPCT